MGVKKPADEKYVKVLVSMPPELKQQLDAYCRENERTVSWVIQKAVAEWISAHA